MMDDLYAKFLPQFVELARGRLERSLETLARPDHAALTTVVREMHAIAGEAGLLGQGAIMALARQGEELAKKLRDSGATVDVDALAVILRDVKNALEHVTVPGKSGGGA